MRGTVICLLIFGLSMVTDSIPVDTRPWTHPCGLRHRFPVISGPLLLDIPLDHTADSDVAQKITISLAELSDLIQDQKDTYISLDAHILPKDSLYIPLDGLPKPGSLDLAMLSTDDLHDYAEESYTTLSTMWVYIEQAKIDAEVNKHINMNEAVKNYDKIILSLRNVLCQLSEVIGSDFDNVRHVGRNVMPERLRDVKGTANQLERDFMLLRDAKMLVDYTRIKYQALRDLS